MTTNGATITSATPAKPREPLQSFYEMILQQNPFENYRLSDPTQMNGDVEAIHHAEFKRICAEADAAAQYTQKGRGLLILGTAGAGKSHLLARLSRQSAKDGSCFVYLHNIQVEPQDLPRYLLKCCVNRLANDRRDRFHETALYRIFEKAFRDAAKQEKITEITQQNAAIVYRRLYERLGKDETVFKTIFNFFCAAYRAHHSTKPEKRIAQAQVAATAVRWLKGDVLDATEAKSIELKLRPGQDSVEMSTELITEVWLTIADLAQDAGCKFILCLDQVDNMRPEQLSELSRVAHALIDAVPNLLVLLAGVDADVIAKLDDGIITTAAAARLKSHDPVHLRLIDQKLARQLLHSRLEPLTIRPAEAKEKPLFQNDDLFPLGTKWFAEEFSDSSKLSPRTVLIRAADRWREIQTKIQELGGEQWLAVWDKYGNQSTEPPTPEQIAAAIDAKIADKLTEHVTLRGLEKSLLPADAGNLRGIVKQLLEHCMNREHGYTLVGVQASLGKETRLSVEEHVDKHKIQTCVQFICTDSATSVAAKLKNLPKADQVEHILLVTDARTGLPLGSAGQKHLTQLRQRGQHQFDEVQLTFEQYAELDALLAVAGEAQSKDLVAEPAPGHVTQITVDQVINNHHQHDRYRKHPLLHHLLTETVVIIEPPKICLDKAKFREFVLGWLPFNMGGNLSQILKDFLGDKTPAGCQFDDCFATAREVILVMHDEEIVSAKPWDKDIFVAIGINA